MKINEEKLAHAKAVHYDFCTRKYRGNAVFYENNLVSVYLRENGARTGGRIIRLSWSLVEETTGAGCSDGIDPEAVGRYARMYGRRRIAHDLLIYLPPPIDPTSVRK